MIEGDVVAGIDASDCGTDTVKSRIQGRCRSLPAKTSAAQFIPQRQVYKLPPDPCVFKIKDRLAGIHLAAPFALKCLYLCYEIRPIGRQCDLLANAIAIVELRLPKDGAKTIASPVHDKIAGKPKIMASVGQSHRC